MDGWTPVSLPVQDSPLSWLMMRDEANISILQSELHLQWLKYLRIYLHIIKLYKTFLKLYVKRLILTFSLVSLVLLYQFT